MWKKVVESSKRQKIKKIRKGNIIKQFHVQECKNSDKNIFVI